MTAFWRKHALGDGALLLFLIFCGFGLLRFSTPVAGAVADSLRLCLEVLLPTLYPFFVLSSLLTGSGIMTRSAPKLEPLTRKLFSLPGSMGGILILGMLCGYPTGARAVADLYRQKGCSSRDALNALRFCNNGGPAFFIGAVGTGMLFDRHTGVVLYGIHVLSALLIGLIFRQKHCPVMPYAFTQKTAASPALPARFLQAVTGSFSSFLNVCAFVLLFAVLTCLLEQLPWFCSLPLWARSLLSGSLELTSGTAMAAAAGLSHRTTLALISFICGWGGWSVHLQSVCFLQEAGLSPGRYLSAKLLHGSLSAVLTLLLC